MLLWRSSEIQRLTKVLGTLYIAAYSVLFVSGILSLLIFVFGVDLVEWRGGYWPVITFSKTVPDYDKLESSRAQQAHNVPRSAARHAPSYIGAYWTGFRGPNHEGVYEEQPILTNWPAAGLRELWRQPIGGGYASFAIAEGRAYCRDIMHNRCPVRFKEDKYWGYKEEGRLTIPAQFDYAGPFYKGIAHVCKDGDLFYIDCDGQLLSGGDTSKFADDKVRPEWSEEEKPMHEPLVAAAIKEDSLRREREQGRH